jgi:hypothetical protein
MSYQEREPIEATVAELKPRMKNVTISFKVTGMNEEREVSSRKDGTTHRVCDITVGDTRRSYLQSNQWIHWTLSRQSPIECW